jgi:hypothetical protein
MALIYSWKRVEAPFTPTFQQSFLRVLVLHKETIRMILEIEIVIFGEAMNRHKIFVSFGNKKDFIQMDLL